MVPASPIEVSRLQPGQFAVPCASLQCGLDHRPKFCVDGVSQPLRFGNSEIAHARSVHFLKGFDPTPCRIRR